jgi:hypothetical protein
MQIIYRKISTKKTLEQEVLKLNVGDTTEPIKIGRKSGELVSVKSMRVALHFIQRDHGTVYRTKEKNQGLVIQRAF